MKQTFPCPPWVLSMLPGRARARVAMVMVMALVMAPAFAQSSGPGSGSIPSAEEMIEQLRKPLTRSMRNLSVEATPAKTDASPNVSPNVSPNAPHNAPPSPTQSIATQGQPASTGQASLSLLIQFDLNSASVRPESQQALTNLSQALASPDLAASRFAVEGHTDARGRADLNLVLSAARAVAVRDFLTSRGIDPKRLVASGKGATDLANSSQPFAAENRRVRVVNLD